MPHSRKARVLSYPYLDRPAREPLAHGYKFTQSQPPQTCVSCYVGTQSALPVRMKPLDPAAALSELRALVATYLEGSDDAGRAQELLAALDPNAPIAIPTEAPLTEDQKARQRRMFGLTTDQLDHVFQGKSARDVAMYAMGTLSNAQELIRRDEYEGQIEYSVSVSNANSIRQFMNIAKYAIDKAVPR